MSNANTFARASSLSVSSRKAARINARIARRIGWRRSDVHVVNDTINLANPQFYASVGGRRSAV